MGNFPGKAVRWMFIEACHAKNRPFRFGWYATLSHAGLMCRVFSLLPEVQRSVRRYRASAQEADCGTDQVSAAGGFLFATGKGRIQEDSPEAWVTGNMQ